MDIGGSVALVTGAASGLGRAAATRLHAAGAKLVLVDTNRDAGQELADAGVGTFVPADVTSETEAQEAVGRATALGPLRVLVNCAGVGWGARIVDKGGGPHDLALFRRILDINPARNPRRRNAGSSSTRRPSPPSRGRWARPPTRPPRRASSA